MQNNIKNKIIELLNTENQSNLIRNNKSVTELLTEFDVEIEANPSSRIPALIDKIVELSVNTDSNLFMNQMYGKLNKTAVYGDVLTTILNTSMYTYEVAPLMTLIEKECIKRLASYVWKDGNSDGVFTPGGSISNMKGLLLARDNHQKNIKTKGLFDAPKYSIFISDQAHYSFTKGAIFMGFGKESVVKIKTDNVGQIVVDDLVNAIEIEKQKGRTPLMLVGVAGTTFSGVFDDLKSLSSIAQKNSMWYHVDAVYGGSLMFSEINQPKFEGIEKADSVSWNLHKVMGIPLVCSAFLTQKPGLLNEAFAVDADYLFHDDEDLDLGQKSIQCGRRVDALKLWLSWKEAGTNGFSERIDKLQAATQLLAQKIKEEPNMELLCEPQSPIVIFRVTDNELSLAENNQLNKKIRDTIFKSGEVLFNYSIFKDVIYLRCVISAPNIPEKDIAKIVNTIKTTYQQLKVNA